MELSQAPPRGNGPTRGVPLAAVRPDDQPAGGFAMHASALVANGYSPVPIKPGTKRPAIVNWSRCCHEALSADEISDIARQFPGAGVAVACGFHGLVAIDVDTDDAEVLKAVQRAIGEGGAPRKGSKGICSFYRLADNEPAPSRQFRKLLDVLGDGRCAVIPPSLHPNGARYKWLGPATLFTTPCDRLPIVGER